MSEISVLSNQYEKLVTTSDQINNSVITLKKRSILNDQQLKRQHPNIKVSVEQVSAAFRQLLPFLKNVQKILKGEVQDSDYIPSLIIEDYKKRLSINPYIVEDIDEITERIEHGQPIEQQYIKVLDEILSVIDSERNALFRKLRTARG